MQTNDSGGNNAETNAMMTEPEDLTWLGLLPQPACRRHNERLPSTSGLENFSAEVLYSFLVSLT